MPGDRTAVVLLSTVLAIAGALGLIRTLDHRDTRVIVATSAVRR